MQCALTSMAIVNIYCRCAIPSVCVYFIENQTLPQGSSNFSQKTKFYLTRDLNSCTTKFIKRARQQPVRLSGFSPNSLYIIFLVKLWLMLGMNTSQSAIQSHCKYIPCSIIISLFDVQKQKFGTDTDDNKLLFITARYYDLILIAA